MCDLWFGMALQRLMTNDMLSQNNEVVEQRNLIKTSAQLNFLLVTAVVHA